MENENKVEELFDGILKDANETANAEVAAEAVETAKKAEPIFEDPASLPAVQEAARAAYEEMVKAEEVKAEAEEKTEEKAEAAAEAVEEAKAEAETIVEEKTEEAAEAVAETANAAAEAVPEPAKKGSVWKKAVLTLVILLGAAYAAGSYYFNDHFFPQTYLNGQDVSFKTVAEVEQQLSAEADTKELVLKGRDDRTAVLSMKKMSGSYVIGDTVSSAKASQSGFNWPTSLFQRSDLEAHPEIVFEDAEVLKQIAKLEMVTKGVKPTDAKLIIDEKGYQIQDEIPGSRIKNDVLVEAVKAAFAEQKTELDLDEADCYVEAAVKAEDVRGTEMAQQLETIFGSDITYLIGEKPIKLGPQDIGAWVKLTEEGVVIDEAGVKSYIDGLADTWDKETAKRVFNSTLRGRIVVPDKVHKWNIDRAKETEALVACLKEGGKIEREPYYLVPSGNYMGSEIGEDYVEVDIAAQHLWVYKGGKVAIETDVVTGCTALGRHTPGQIGYIFLLQKDRVLRGDNYASFVHFWAPFYRGYGLHDANWRGKFGGEIYKTGGSHGCVNIPPKVMPEVYKLLELGMPVVTYY